MADSSVAITAGIGTSIDTRTEATNGDHRQVVVIGDPSATAGVATVSTGGALLVGGAASSGSAVTGNPNLIGGSDGTNARTISTDTSGRLITVQPDTSTAISIAANATSSGQITSLTGAGAAWIQLTGTWTATAQVQVTVDGSTWVNLTGSQSIITVSTGAYVTSGNLTATGIYMVDIAGASGVRVITTAYTSGTITGTVRVVSGVASAGITGSPVVSGTVYATLNITSVVYTLTTTASTNSNLAITGSKAFGTVALSNTSASAIYVKFYNKATAPTVGTDIPYMTIAVPANGFVNYDFSQAIRFNLGIGVGVTGAVADSDTTAVAAGCHVLLTYL